MVTFANTWEYPAPRVNEEWEMEAVVDEVLSGDLRYDGSVRRDITRNKKIMIRNRTIETTRDYLETCADVCVGGILGCVDMEVDPIIHTRRLMNVMNTLDDLD
tara:strand:+ start:67 stop:375 length:309 start_codon:yes stop_codon:yes gene_type:complete